MNVLIVGAKGYIGESLALYAKNHYPMNTHIVDSFKGWKKVSFEGYDSVIFAAGIAHRKQTLKNAALYFAVNRDLACAVAKKAKLAKVPQFIYLSSMAVFGKKEGEISEHTKPNPRNNDYYGKSKFQAERKLQKLENSAFAVAIVRPPMVYSAYGTYCPGKFAQLTQIAKLSPMVLENHNKRSILYINNLSEFLCTIIRLRAKGIFHPQNAEHTSTANLIQLLRRKMGKKTILLKINGSYFLQMFKMAMVIIPPLQTAFGSLYYTAEIPSIPYKAIGLEETI
ncbi:MAG: NAD-dependent epimerase/dehydratase family protein [Defluviitaleaceae bacterium]|nr:NAD-dependent epimerase/dehydratase family protein [Defluviitaleaceae bacterium]